MLIRPVLRVVRRYNVEVPVGLALRRGTRPTDSRVEANPTARAVELPRPQSADIDPASISGELSERHGIVFYKR